MSKTVYYASVNATVIKSLIAVLLCTGDCSVAEDQQRVQQLTGRIGRTIGMACVRQVSCWTTFIFIQ